MAGHTFSPFALTATRAHARKDKSELMLASLGEKQPVDLLHALHSGLGAVGPRTSSEGAVSISPQAWRINGDALEFVLAVDVKGIREIIRDGGLDGLPIKAIRDKDDVGRIFACCAVWRPPAGSRGVLLVHSPFGRGGSKTAILAILQEALNLAVPPAKAKLHADVLIPNDAIEKILKNAKATKIVYSKSTGISSSFGEQDQKGTSVSAPAEVGLVVKGENTKTYRDALSKALRSEPKDKLFTVKVRHEGPDGTSTFVEETFDDVQVVFDDASGQTRYSISQETIPRVRFEKTNEINAVYYALDEDDRETWPEQLLEGASKDVLRLVAEISQRM